MKTSTALSILAAATAATAQSQCASLTSAFGDCVVSLNRKLISDEITFAN